MWNVAGFYTVKFRVGWFKSWWFKSLILIVI